MAADEPDVEQGEPEDALVEPVEDPGTAVAEPPAQPAPAPSAHRLTDQEARQWALGAHLSGLAWIAGIPGLIGPLIVWLVKKDEHPMVDRHGTEALNFQLSLFIYGVVAAALAITIIGLVVAIPAIIVLFVMAIVFPIVAAVKVSNGEDYRYPLTMRLIG